MSRQPVRTTFLRTNYVRIAFIPSLNIPTKEERNKEGHKSAHLKLGRRPLSGQLYDLCYEMFVGFLQFSIFGPSA